MRSLLYSMMLAALLIGIVGEAVADMGSLSYRISASVLSGGGTTMDSAGYHMTATLGQPSGIGLLSKRPYIGYAGFWQPTELKLRSRALPWVYLLLLDD